MPLRAGPAKFKICSASHRRQQGAEGPTPAFAAHTMKLVSKFA
jgi:hypothetical protein